MCGHPVTLTSKFNRLIFVHNCSEGVNLVEFSGTAFIRYRVNKVIFDHYRGFDP